MVDLARSDSTESVFNKINRNGLNYNRSLVIYKSVHTQNTIMYRREKHCHSHVAHTNDESLLFDEPD